jgi:hypothetical protein
VFSLPKAFFLWGLGLFTSHIIFLALRLISTGAAIGATVFILGIFLGIRCITSTVESTSWNRLISRFSMDKEIEEISKV